MMADRVSNEKMRVTKNSGIGNVENEIMEVKFDILDEDDDILIQAEDATYTEQAQENMDETEVDLDGINFDEDMEDDEAANISIGLVSDNCGNAADKDSGDSEFDYSTGKLWIYPTNYPIRDYQYNIVQQALYNNTLVVLPTGLGKTFIAAVVMYNFFRWFSQGKIVFMAPTKPLVAQQIQACYNIMGIPKADTVEMTGTMAPSVRQKAWKEKRVVFLTPQVMTNDLSRGSLTADSIKCLVLDEAHKALGNHAYCQVIRELVKFSRQFRVLALSATPGGDLKAVQQVLNNLLISHIELRSEEAIDIRPYTHERKVEKIVVPLGEELSSLRLKYIQIMTCTVQRLIRNQVLYNREATKLSKFLLLKARDEFRQNPQQNLSKVQYGNIEADFAMAISLYHGFELLQLHGLRSLYNFLTGIIVGEKGYGRTRSELLKNAYFNEVMEILRQKFVASGIQGVSSVPGDGKLVIGHPKMQRLEEIVVDHFRSFQKNGDVTRVMIFSQYRDSVQEIATILSQHQPLIKVMPFIGQSSAGKATKGYTQKEQLLVMRQFREGGYNTLVSTCVGEEGLDIGDVDLIVCFDAHKSPIRLVQRMGRTGRKRQGRIVMLVTEGKEEQIYNQSVYSKKSIHKAILNGAKSLHFYPNNPRMIPSSVTPKCHKMYITVASDSNKNTKTSGKSKSPIGSKSRKISDIFGKEVTGVVEEAYLTSEEYSEIQKEFAELSSTAKHLPKPKCITLSAHTENMCDKSNSSTSQLINLAEWMPWQNRLQSTHTVGHSIQSSNLVKTAEFIELQQCIGDEEDQYGLEMNKLLNEKDIDSVLQKCDGQSSMCSFLSKVHNSETTSSKSRVKVNDTISSRKLGKKGKPKSRNRKQKAADTVTEPILIGSDSSLDEQSTANTGTLKLEVSKLFTELGDHDDKTSSQVCDSVKKGFVKGVKTDLNKTTSLDGRKPAKGKVQLVKKKKQTCVAQRAKNKKLKIKNKSILELTGLDSQTISSTPDDDFETDFPRRKRSEGLLDSVKKGTIDIDGIQGHHNDAVTDSTTSDVHTAIHDSGTGNSVSENFLPYAFKSPIINTQNQGTEEFHVNRCINLIQAANIKDPEAFHIPKPPPISEVNELFQRLKSGKEFAELDLGELMELWNEPKVEVCTSGNLQNKSFLSQDKQSCLKVISTKQTTRFDASWEKETLVINTGSNVRRFANEDTGNHIKQIVRPCYVDVLNDSEDSLNNSSTAANKTKEHNTSKSPLFKSTTSRSVHKTKDSQFGKSGSHEEMSPQGKEEVIKTFIVSDLGFSEDPRHDRSFTRSRAHINETSQHHLELHISSENIKKSDSLIKEVGHSPLSNSFITVDDTEMNRSISIRKTSPDRFHESFVTFTQAMDFLHSSSSDEAVMTFDISTPCASPSKGNAYFGSSRYDIKGLASDTNIQSKTESAVSSPLHQPSLRNCNKNSKFTAEVFSHTGEHIISAVSAIESSKVSLQYLHGDPARDAYPRTREKSLTKSSIETPLFASNNGPNNVDLPQFDLGFELDDDDDVIPPTPTKTLSPESVFGFKTVTTSKNFSQDIDTFSPFTDKTSEPVRHPQSVTTSVNLSAPSVFTSTEKFEPLVNNFDLNLLSDEENDGQFSENLRKESLKHHMHASESSTKDQQIEEKLCQGTLNILPLKLGSGKFSESSEVVPFDNEKDTFGIKISNFPFSENENDETVPLPSSLHSPAKRQKLPFDRYSNITENDARINSAEDRQFTDELSAELCGKSRAGKLKLGKRRNYVLDSVYENSKTSMITSGNDDICEPYQIKSCEKSIDEVSRNLNHFDETDEFSKQVSESVNKCSSPVNKMLFSSPLNTRHACKGTEMPSAYIETSPDANEKPEYVAEIKASTPILKTSGDGHLIKAVTSPDNDIPELTPIRAHIDEDKCDSGDSVIVRRRKRVLFLDVSSDCDHTNAVAQSKQSIVNKKSRVKKSEMGAEFIEREAVESGADGSSDEHEDMDDFYESSFIDNNTEVTHTQSTDMKAVYLKSIKSRVLDGHAGRYKMQYNNKRMADVEIFSQTLPEDHGLSEYEEDSFCVGSDEEDIIYQDEESQLSQHKQKQYSKPKAEQKKEKRRIKVMIHTSSDEEENTRIQMTQEFSIRPPSKFGRRVLLSSSEDERESKGDQTSARNMVLHEARSLKKSYNTFLSDNCNTDTVRSEGLNSMKISDAVQKPEQNTKSAANIHPVLKECEPAVTEVGNFDLLGEIDWFDDFEMPEGTDSSKIVKLETKRFSSESNLLTVENPAYPFEKDVAVHNDSHNYIHGKSSTDFKLYSGIPSTSKTLSSDYVADGSVCYNSRDQDRWSKDDAKFEFNKKQSPSQVTFLSHCGSSASYASSASKNTYSAATDLLENSHMNVNSSKPAVSMTREDRLRKQKEKQEMYRKKLKHVQQINNSTRTSVTDSVTSVVIPEADSVIDNAHCPAEVCDSASKTGFVDSNGHGQTSPSFTKIMDAKRTGHQLQILVDTREISGAQEIISALRLKHSITVTARQLSCCDYILSNHLAADRVQWSTFTNGSYRSKLSSRLCEMQALYEQCALVVEADRLKAGQEKSRKPIHRTKYLDTTLCYLAQSKIKVYFTDNVEETATILADLCRVEQTKGRAINVPTVLSSAKEEVFNFVLSMPRVTVLQALNLAHRFRSIFELLSSPATVIQERGCMTTDSAQTLHQFLHHKFDIHTMPKK